MRLKNKKTGEIGELQITEKHYAVVVGNGTASCNAEIYCSLTKLNEEWEDYEEQKGYYYVTTTGLIKYDDTPFCAIHKDRKEIGNYFESKEEAEKAVERLRAWKRLKDKGFRFRDWNWETQCIDYNLDYTDITEEQIEESEEDLDLLFGGEE